MIKPESSNQNWLGLAVFIDDCGAQYLLQRHFRALESVRAVDHNPSFAANAN
jgi:hypothetical protein